MATNHDVPGISGPDDDFWTDNFFVNLNNDVAAIVVDEDGEVGSLVISNATVKTVCVTDPSV